MIWHSTKSSSLLIIRWFRTKTVLQSKNSRKQKDQAQLEEKHHNKFQLEDHFPSKYLLACGAWITASFMASGLRSRLCALTNGSPCSASAPSFTYFLRQGSAQHVSSHGFPLKNAGNMCGTAWYTWISFARFFRYFKMKNTHTHIITHYSNMTLQYPVINLH
jgi:hypothetical protein